MRRMNFHPPRFSFVLAPLCAVALLAAPSVQAQDREFQEEEELHEEEELRKDEPTVKITSPKNKAKFDEGKSVKVKVSAKAASKKGKIAKVVLEVDGEEEKADKKAPYEWTLKKLKPGKHKLRAIATDDDDNEGKSKTITITVKGDEEEGDGKDKDKDKDGEDGTDDTDGTNTDDGGGADMPPKFRKKGCSIDQDANGWLGALMVLGLLGWRRARRSGE